MKFKSTRFLAIVALLLVTASGRPIFGTPPQKRPYTVFEDMVPLASRVKKSDLGNLFENVVLKGVESNWKSWDECGVRPVGIRRFRYHGRPWWNFWTKMRWQKFQIPIESMPDILRCEEPIPLGMDISFQYRNQNWRLSAGAELKGGELIFSTQPRLIKQAIDQINYSTGTFGVSGLKVRFDGPTRPQIHAGGGGVYFPWGLTAQVENKIPIIISLSHENFPLKSLTWMADFSKSLNGDAALREIAPNLGYKGEVFSCARKSNCSLFLRGGIIMIILKEEGLAIQGSTPHFTFDSFKSSKPLKGLPRMSEVISHPEVVAFLEHKNTLKFLVRYSRRWDGQVQVDFHRTGRKRKAGNFDVLTVRTKDKKSAKLQFSIRKKRKL